MKIVVICFCLISHILFSQNIEVDSVLNLSYQWKDKDDLKALKFAKQADELAIQSGDKTLQYKTILLIAEILYTLDMSNKSLEYLEKAQKNPMYYNDVIMQAKARKLKIMNYQLLEIKGAEKEEIDNTIKLLLKEKSDEAKKLLSEVYALQSIYYMFEDDLSASNNSINKGLKLEAELPKPPFVSITLQKASVCLDMKKNDSAFYFINKALEIHRKFHPKTYNYDIYYLLGEYYNQIEDYAAALSAYSKVLEGLKKGGVKDTYIFIDAKRNMADIYTKLGDHTKALKYQNEYEQEYKEFDENNYKGIVKAVDLILAEKKTDKQELRKRNTILVVIISSLFSLLIIFLYLKYTRLKKKKKQIQLHKAALLEEKSKLELEKEKLSQEVKQSSYDQLISLAKSNDPEFLLLFIEMHPDFVESIKKLNPKIRNSELHFCALAYLNFSTKDIANYTFVTVSAVQLRKHRIRKKYNIPSELGFNAWMRNLESF